MSEICNNHLNTHSLNAVRDKKTVACLENFLSSNGKINTKFEAYSTWPNIDGSFELVQEPDLSRAPIKNFCVQIKGTENDYEEDENEIKYRLMDLAFIQYIRDEVTSDPGILFVVINTGKKGKERVFWKYISTEFIKSVDFNKKSYLISFSKEDEIFNTDDSINHFVEKLIKICKQHSFVKKLEIVNQKSVEDVKRIIETCNIFITEAIERFELFNDTRDAVSRRMLPHLQDLCEATLYCNAFNRNYKEPSLRLAWEISLMDIETKFLDRFLQSLKYIARRIPEDGQNERLILSYYDYLWQIREYLKFHNNINILQNLEKFPINQVQDDIDYYVEVSKAIEKHCHDLNGFSKPRYYIEKKRPFFIGKKRYFELTLQLAGRFASKFNRLTVYSKIDVSTDYSIQIGYSECNVKFFDINSNIKILTTWKVAIDPSVINKFSLIVGNEIKISSNYGEYNALMQFLTRTGCNLLDITDLRKQNFEITLNNIFVKSNTDYLKQLLIRLRNIISDESTTKGKNTIRYALIRLREEMIYNLLPENENDRYFNKDLFLTKSCNCFESDPYLYNIPKQKTNKNIISKDVLRAVGTKNCEYKIPYIRLKNLTETTGQVYIEKSEIIDNFDNNEIDIFNNHLSKFDITQGKEIKQYKDYLYIDEYEKSSIFILNWLLEHSKSGNNGQEIVNNKFIKDNPELFKDDETKKLAIKKLFCQSKILAIYGAAGTGKTTLMNYISTLMDGRNKLFITKTHTALNNLKNRIKSQSQSKFITIDRFIKAKNEINYDIVFIDECSNIDNRSMMETLKKIKDTSLLVIAGDIYQIESIDFGNWFNYARTILNNESKIELTNTWRTDLKELKKLWEEVRNKGNLITDILVIDGPFSEAISNNLFKSNDIDDEIVLCLNYDGRFGLNNINNYFQDVNPNTPYSWHDWKYKKNDQILFNETKRFPKLYNNLKGKIYDIIKEEESITFIVDVYTNLTEIDALNSEFSIVEYFDEYTRIQFSIYENQGGTTDEEREDSKMKSIVPFQLAYAVSIHKSQGLEYDSVKIVIPNNNKEQISHGVFYTAITRAKTKLKIFWSAETMTNVVKNIQNESNRDISLEILKSKLNN